MCLGEPSCLWSHVALFTGEGNGTLLRYSCLENPTDGGAGWAAVHGVAEGRMRLSDFTFTFHFHALEKEMATHSSVLAWRIPGTGEPGGLPSVGSHRVGHDWSDLAAAALFIHISVYSCRGDGRQRDGYQPLQDRWSAPGLLGHTSFPFLLCLCSVSFSSPLCRTCVLYQFPRILSSVPFLFFKFTFKKFYLFLIEG